MTIRIILGDPERNSTDGKKLGGEIIIIASLADALVMQSRLVGEERLHDEPKEHLPGRLSS